jgi:uncharacterized membrane protein YphA (DoxX/SURF4 family)
VSTHVRPRALLLPVAVVGAGWVCAAHGFRKVCGTMTGTDPMPFFGVEATPLYYVGYLLASVGALTFVVLIGLLLRQRYQTPR